VYDAERSEIDVRPNLALAMMVLLGGCNAAGVTSTATPRAAIPGIRDALGSAVYPIEGVSSGHAQLLDGRFEAPAAPGSAARTTVQLGVSRAFGDMNGDGSEDAAVTLVVDFGGSGTFTYLAAVINQAGTAKALPAVLLGDRVVVNSLAIRDGSVVVEMLTRRSNEPMTDKPTVAVTRIFRLHGDTLVEAN
jgi:hypothetical protein